MSGYNITAGVPTFEVLHLGKTVLIQREQNPSATIRADYALTARACPLAAFSRCNWLRVLKRWVSWKCWIA